MWLRPLILLALVGLLPWQALARAPAPRPRDARWWMERHAHLNRLPGRSAARVIFLGDSITEGWTGPGLAVWQRHYAARGALNLGISGDRLCHLLWRLQHGAVDGLSPRAAVLLIGVNDVAFHGTPARDVVDGITTIVRELRARLPRTKILVMGLLPASRRPDALRERIARVNRLLAREVVGKDPMVELLDIGGGLLEPDGTLPVEVSYDHLHLGEKGYRLWAEAIEPALGRMLGER